jgi:hypothetical protein
MPMQLTEIIRCEYRGNEDPSLAGFALIVPSELWDDFRLFLIHACIEGGRTDSQFTADGKCERLQFFSKRNAAEVEQVKIAYLFDYRARCLD